MRTFVLAATAVASMLFAAAPTLARAADWTVGVTIGTASGSTDGDTNYAPADVSPSGSTIGIIGGVSFDVADHFVLGIEAGVKAGDVSASDTSLSCPAAFCGVDEYVTYTESGSWSASLGGSIGHPVGPVLLSAVGGLEVGDFTRTFKYDSGDYWPTYVFERTGYRVGGYAGLRADYAVNDRWSVRAEARRSVLNELSFSSNGNGGDSDVYTEDSLRVGIIRTFD